MGFLSGILGGSKQSREDIEREAAQELGQFINTGPSSPSTQAQNGAFGATAPDAQKPADSMEQASS